MSSTVNSDTDLKFNQFFSCKRCCERLFGESLVTHYSRTEVSTLSRIELEPNDATLSDENQGDTKPALSRKEWLKESWVNASAAAGTGCTSVFLHSLPDWAANSEGNSGRFACPKCEAKIGNYVWSGASCSCGVWVTPSFQFQLARVDRKGTVLVPATRPNAQLE